MNSSITSVVSVLTIMSWPLEAISSNDDSDVTQPGHSDNAKWRAQFEYVTYNYV